MKADVLEAKPLVQLTLDTDEAVALYYSINADEEYLRGSGLPNVAHAAALAREVERVLESTLLGAGVDF